MAGISGGRTAFLENWVRMGKGKPWENQKRSNIVSDPVTVTGSILIIILLADNLAHPDGS